MKRKHRIAFRRVVSRTFVLGPLVFLLVAGAGCPSLFESATERATRIRQAVPGKDGDATISADTIVNVYAPLAGTVNPVAGDKAITVTDATFLSAVTKGDLLLIVQMAGATTDTTNTASYGTILAPLNLGGAGLYEFIGVEGKSGTQVTLACGLKNGYSLTGKTQVIRVPQYANLTIDGNASIGAPAWNGAVGGVVAVHAEKTLQLNGSIKVSAKGFQGGAAHNSTNTTGQVPVYRSTDPTAGGGKGEGIAGYGTEYTTGQYGRGAPANGGGGGDSHNAGGGGGANARNGVAWTGQGVMLDSVAGAAAWDLDPSTINNPAAPNTLTNSEGGGRGGYSYSNAALNPLTSGPDLPGWGGDDRREVGGLGGHPLDNDPTSRLFMGGGGGAGDGNNGVAGPGGRGGGLIFIIAGAVTGSGTIHADGEVGGSSTGAAGNAGDAAGGGGGGGTVVVNAASIDPTVTITAAGGPGGNHANSSGANEVEGPGGGGGGGYIALSGTGSPSLSAAGGLGGTTTVTPSAMNNFRSNGATAGNAGQTDGDATSFFYCGGVFTSFATHPERYTTSTTGAFTFTNTSDPVTYECQLTTPAGTGSWAPCSGTDAGTEGYATGILTVGDYTLSVRATDTFGNHESPPVTFLWTVQALGLDGGVDAEPVDLGLDNSGAEVPPALVDAEAIDVLVSEDLVSAQDMAEADVAADTAAVKGDDTAPIVFIDAAADAGNADLFLPVLDVAEGIDTQVLAVDVAAVDVASADAQADTQPSGAEPKADTAPLPEPSRDSAGPIVKEDAALPPVNKDAAPAVDDLKILGSGFCAIAGSRSTSPTPFMTMGLAALALLHRRRRPK
jgi:hypothetical protein